MEIEVAAAKVSKYAVQESGDTLEMVERPGGGFSFVLSDGQGSGFGAKAISHLVARKAASLLAEGVRDGAVARAAHDTLYALRRGKVSADLTIASVDMESRTIVLSRNGGAPVLVAHGADVQGLGDASQPIGIYQWTKPSITELPITGGACVAVMSDGVAEGGLRYGQAIQLPAILSSALAQPGATAQSVADSILSAAMAADKGRPADDMSVLVLLIGEDPGGDGARRMSVRFPV